MIDQQTVQDFSAPAAEWACAQEEFILTRGSPLTQRAEMDARRAGVQNPARVRVLVVDRIPLPADEKLAEASRRAHIITDASRGVAIGYGIIIRGDCWGDRELLLHQLVHVAQCERSGGLGTFVHEYLRDRQTSAEFSIGALEEEARRVARELCAAE